MTPKFLFDPKVFDPKSIRTKNKFLETTFFCRKTFFWTQIFFRPKILSDKFFFLFKYILNQAQHFCSQSCFIQKTQINKMYQMYFASQMYYPHKMYYTLYVLCTLDVLYTIYFTQQIYFPQQMYFKSQIHQTSQIHQMNRGSKKPYPHCKKMYDNPILL